MCIRDRISTVDVRVMTTHTLTAIHIMQQVVGTSIPLIINSVLIAGIVTAAELPVVTGIGIVTAWVASTGRSLNSYLLGCRRIGP